MMKVVVSQQPMQVKSGEVVANKAPSMSYGEYRSQFEGNGEVGFLDMFMAQLEGSGENGADALLAGMQQAQEDAEDEGINLGMQMLAELLGSTPATETLVQEIAEQNPELVANLQTMAQEGTTSPLQNGVLEQLQSMNQVERPETTGSVVYQEVDSIPSHLLSEEASDDLGAEVIDAMANVSDGESADGEESPDSLLNGESQFNNNVAEAKKLLKTNSQESQLAYNAIDIDKLQSNADAARLNVSKASESSSLPEAKEVFSQLKEGVTENVSEGKSEFTVKLKPDGLGEITVKLVEGSDNKMTLSLMTSNTQVAKMLSNEIGLLRETMKPYNVEVREIVNQAGSSEQAQNTAANENFAQSFAGQQGHQYAREGFAEYYYDRDNDPDAPFPTEVIQQADALSGLDTYI